jgi:hypothetical protein
VDPIVLLAVQALWSNRERQRAERPIVVGDNVVTSHQDIGLDRVDCWMGGKR